MQTLYHSGRILTMVDRDDAPEAVLIEDGLITGVGTLADLRERADASAGADRVDEVDLTGRTLMPSFIDSHGHLLAHGRLAALVDLEGARSIDEVVAAFRERLAARDAGDDSPLIGAKYDPTQLAEGRHPTRDDLDRVSTEIPVLAMHRSMHVGAANSVLVEAAGITAETPDPEGGRFGRRDDGSPDGFAEEHAALGALFAALDPEGGASSILGGGDASAALRLAADDYLRHGITTAQEGAASPDAVTDLAEAARAGELPLDLVVYPVAAWGAPAREQFAERAPPPPTP
ncbi:amidohydrolase family protein [Brachybacterium halotolerans subsp. kimchii]|uniref:amidohydrolase family protein n=1 Tax=Brachybacterium halotolerans TaxID=2795215 RepID=UPI001E40E94A|nr:amidohydrolase family protein [Brachybacterium halotolerans]UEJ84523.1 amidohydrolase family protein [Brachybacterium halotolerans subsp. kimchii]